MKKIKEEEEEKKRRMEKEKRSYLRRRCGKQKWDLKVKQNQKGVYENKEMNNTETLEQLLDERQEVDGDHQHWNLSLHFSFQPNYVKSSSHSYDFTLNPSNQPKSFNFLANQNLENQGWNQMRPHNYIFNLQQPLDYNFEEMGSYYPEHDANLNPDNQNDSNKGIIYESNPQPNQNEQQVNIEQVELKFQENQIKKKMEKQNLELSQISSELMKETNKKEQKKKKSQISEKTEIIKRQLLTKNVTENRTNESCQQGEITFEEETKNNFEKKIKKLKNDESKNVTRDISRGFNDYLEKKQSSVNLLLGDAIKFEDFMNYVKEKNPRSSIKDLKSAWVDSVKDEKKRKMNFVYRRFCLKFLKEEAIAYIFFKKFKNSLALIEGVRSLIKAVNDPENFHKVKEQGPSEKKKQAKKQKQQ